MSCSRARLPRAEADGAHCTAGMVNCSSSRQLAKVASSGLDAFAGAMGATSKL